MQIEDETLMAYADGELTPLEAKRIEAAMAEDAALAARVARFRAVRRALRTAYDSVAAEPVPEHLRALLGDVATHEPTEPPAQVAPVVDLAAARAARSKVSFGPPAWAAMAASLVIGVLAGRALLTQEGPFVGDAGNLYAGASLAQVLDSQLASAPQNTNAATRIGVTFRSHDGQICRTFVQNSAVSGLACRDGQRWAVRVAVADHENGGAYRQAGSAAPAVLTMVDSLIEGDAFDADQERAARDHGWQR